jgi:hypothetical protein
VELEGALMPAPSLVVLDGMTEALAMEGLDLNSNTDVAKWIVALPRRIALDTGAAVLIIDHQTKDREQRGGFAIGAQHKKAGIHVAYSIKAVKPFGRGLDGSSRIRVEKDRPGHVRRHAEDGVVAEMKFTSKSDSGAVTIELQPPNPEAWRPADRMEAISLALEEAGEAGLNRSELLRAVGGREATSDNAIRALKETGHIRVVPGGRGNPTMHYIKKAYRQPVEGS